VLDKPTCISIEHSILLKDYLDTLINGIEDITGSNKSKFQDYVDVCNVVIAHHNGYKKHSSSQNFYDFMSIIPTNMSVMTTGFLAGIETKRNAKRARAYRLFFTNYAYELVERLNNIPLQDD